MSLGEWAKGQTGYWGWGSIHRETESDEEPIGKKIKLDEEESDVEEVIEGLEEEEEEELVEFPAKKEKKEDDDYVYVDKLPSNEA